MPFVTPSTKAPTRRTGRRFAAIVIALAAFSAAAAMWLWISLQAVQVPLFGWQNGVIFGGSGVFCLALLAALRAGFENLLDWLWAVLAALAAVVVSVFWGLLSLFGWD